MPRPLPCPPLMVKPARKGAGGDSGIGDRGDVGHTSSEFAGKSNDLVGWERIYLGIVATAEPGCKSRTHFWLHAGAGEPAPRSSFSGSPSTHSGHEER